MTTLDRFVRIGLGIAALLVSSVSSAQAWPDKPIRVVVPYPPGGPSDIVLRSAAEKMQPVLKQPIVLENKPGAGGTLGASEAARSAPDGYTWFWSTDNTVTINPHVYKKLPYRVDDLVPVTIASSFSQVLVCHPSLGVKTLGEFVAKARASKLSYASGGAGVPGHLAMELLLATAGLDMLHIPYKGPAAATQDVIGNQVPCGFLAGPTVLPHIRSGRLVGLAVSGATRSAMLPEVPTVAEAGYPGYDATFMLVLFAPHGTPEPIVAAMHKAMVDALRLPDVVDKLRLTDQGVVASTPAEAAAALAATSRKWGEVARRIGLSLD
ncbi:MAG: tripartite tricarboxylate transporter substrate binding protein [Piscinibacter sp.]|nr:tripartite tricarboxylate transporter substrate binding protein [Piscinibacter sp.]